MNLCTSPRQPAGLKRHRLPCIVPEPSGPATTPTNGEADILIIGAEPLEDRYANVRPSNMDQTARISLRQKQSCQKAPDRKPRKTAIPDVPRRQTLSGSRQHLSAGDRRGYRPHDPDPQDPKTTKTGKFRKPLKNKRKYQKHNKQKEVSRLSRRDGTRGRGPIDAPARPP